MADISSYTASVFGDKSVSVARKLLVGGKDYSHLVTRWPSITRDEKTVSPGNVTVLLDAAGGKLNTFVNSASAIVTSAHLLIGADVNSLGLVYSGIVSGMTIKRGVASLVMKNKLYKLTVREIGTEESPVTFTDSTLPSDIFWAICTSYGGLSAVQSDSNPDIDYPAFATWANVFSRDSVFMNGEFTGIKCMEALRKLARYTDSTITADFTKIVPRRFDQTLSAVDSVTDSELADMRVVISDNEVVNKFTTYGAYDTTSRQYGAAVTLVNTASRDVYDSREKTEKDASIWYVSSSACQNLSERRIAYYADVRNTHEYVTGLTQIQRHIGDTVFIQDAQLGISDTPIRITRIKLDMQTGRMTFGAQVSSISEGFTLDVSTLDGPALLL